MSSTRTWPACGVIAAAASVLIMMPVVSVVSPYADVFLPELGLSAYFYGHFPQLFGYQLLFGIILGAASATVAVRRYLKI
jgi:cell division protein FtsX